MRDLNVREFVSTPLPHGLGDGEAWAGTGAQAAAAAAAASSYVLQDGSTRSQQPPLSMEQEVASMRRSATQSKPVLGERTDGYVRHILLILYGPSHPACSASSGSQSCSSGGSRRACTSAPAH
eukprot:COSAG01_NODE_2364_length_7819_cov_14.933549_7_plen_123_part_00